MQNKGNKEYKNTQNNVRKQRKKVKSGSPGKGGAIVVTVFTLVIVILAVGVLFLRFYQPDVDHTPGFDTGGNIFADTAPGNNGSSDDSSGSSEQYKRRDGVYNFLFVANHYLVKNVHK